MVVSRGGFTRQPVKVTCLEGFRKVRPARLPILSVAFSLAELAGAKKPQLVQTTRKKNYEQQIR
jgi:hypothetical protein